MALLAPKALKPTTASTTFFTSSPSRYRMEGTSIALPAVGTIVARTAASGQRALVQAPPLGACTSAVSTSGRSSVTIRRTVSQFVASPVNLATSVSNLSAPKLGLKISINKDRDFERRFSDSILHIRNVKKGVNSAVCVY